MFYINSLSSYGYSTETLYIISFLAILSAIFVIIIANPIVSILYLIGLFATISTYLLIIGLSFIALSYLIVYIGAVSILFLFILMLINVRISELQSNTSNSLPLAIIVALLFNYPLYQILPYSISLQNNILNNKMDNSIKNVNEYLNDNIYFTVSKAWDNNLIDTTHITSIGNIMYSNYSIWLLMASFILLLAMVGAIIITIKQENK